MRIDAFCVKICLKERTEWKGNFHSTRILISLRGLFRKNNAFYLTATIVATCAKVLLDASPVVFVVAMIDAVVVIVAIVVTVVAIGATIYAVVVAVNVAHFLRLMR